MSSDHHVSADPTVGGTRPNQMNLGEVADDAQLPSSAAVSPTKEETLPLWASEVIGGPPGKHLIDPPRRCRTLLTIPAFAVLAATATWIVALIIRQPCRANLWSAPGQFTKMCYSDVPTTFASMDLADGRFPWFSAGETDAWVHQPLGASALLWFYGLIGQAVPGETEPSRSAFDIGVIVSFVALMIVVLAVMKLAGRRPWDALLVALSPVVLIAGLVSWDLIPIAATMIALVAFSQGKGIIAGVCSALAVLISPLMAFGVVLAVTIFSTRCIARATSAQLVLTLQYVGISAVIPAAVWFVMSRVSPQALEASFSLYTESAASYGSLWFMPTVAHRNAPSEWLMTTVSIIVPIAVTVLVILMVYLPKTQPRLPSVVLVMLAGLTALWPVVPVQQSLWLVPFVALAIPQWSIVLPWGVVEVVYNITTWMYIHSFSDANRGAPEWLYGALLMIRLIVILVLGIIAWAAAEDPAYDKVRTPRAEPEHAQFDPAVGKLITKTT